MRYCSYTILLWNYPHFLKIWISTNLLNTYKSKQKFHCVTCSYNSGKYEIYIIQRNILLVHKNFYRQLIIIQIVINLQKIKFMFSPIQFAKFMLIWSYKSFWNVWHQSLKKHLGEYMYAKNIRPLLDIFKTDINFKNHWMKFENNYCRLV